MLKTTLPAAEGLLLDYVRRLERHRDGRVAIWLQFSRLEPPCRPEPDLQRANNLLRPLARRFQGDVFLLHAGDLILVVKQPEQALVDKAIADVMAIFAANPALDRPMLANLHSLVARFDISRDYASFAARMMSATSTPPAATMFSQSQNSELAPRIVTRQDLQAARPGFSGHVNTPQGRIAVERLLNREPIAHLKDSKGGPLWGMRECVRVEAIDAFDALSTALARRQIRGGEAFGQIECALFPAWIDLWRKQSRGLLVLRLDSLMSAEFLAFDKEVSDLGLGRPHIALLSEDLMADQSTAKYVRAYLAERGYRIGLAGAGFEDLAAARDQVSGMHFFEFNQLGEPKPQMLNAMHRLVSELGTESVFVHHVTSAQALEAIYGAGVRLVSGPSVQVT